MVPSKILIVDSSALCYAAHYGISGLSTRTGDSTSIIYGFFLQIQQVCRAQRVAHIAFCWDSKQSHRKRIFPEYKAHRERKNDPNLQDSFIQFQAIRDIILPRLGFINNFMVTGYEGDDLIASLCRFPAPQKDQQYIIMSNDGDLFQLLTANVSMYKPGKRQLYTKRHFMEEHRIDPLFWAGAKAMAGCPTDDVPGIKGVGIKTAVKYILDEATHKNIETPEGRSIASFNLPLVSLPFKGTPKFALDWTDPPDYAEWVALCEQYELHSFLRDSSPWEQIFSGLAPVEARDRVVIGGRKMQKLGKG